MPLGFMFMQDYFSRDLHQRTVDKAKHGDYPQMDLILEYIYART